ncbi:MAG: AAA family ATPase [Thermodesulfovibrionales bacterium]|nr:AAA family ATPase [Thermodesulfovibrionales bacterium]
MIRKLKEEDLINTCKAELFDFETTCDINMPCSIIGQKRALNALSFGLGIDSKGFNIYALGENGTGKTSTIRKLLNEKTKNEPVPPDWCYVFNFKDPDSPLSISLPPGKAIEFQKDMEELVKMLRYEIPKAFDSKDYEKQRSKLIEAFHKRQKELFTPIEAKCQENKFSIRKGQSSLIIVPVKDDGEPMTEEEFTALPIEEKQSIEKVGRSLQEELDDVLRAVRIEEKKLKENFIALDKNIVLNATGYLFDALFDKYREIEKVIVYLRAVMDDVLSHIEDFKPTDEQQNPPFPFMKKQDSNLVRYSVNVIVNNSALSGAPVIFESNPTYPNLCGRIEHKFQYGMAITDFTMIKAGALHRANGGYIVINALETLKNLFSYDALKRAIKNKEIKIEDAWEQYRLVSTSTLRPEPIPLSVKVIFVGSIYLYYLLYNYDDDFRELFKVKADFDSTMPRNEETMRLYATFTASCQQQENLKPLDKTAVCKIVEAGSRLANHKGRLSTKFSEIIDLIREANYRATIEGAEFITERHVKESIKEKIYRSNRIEERIQDLIDEDTIIIDSSGSKIGQINGLTILDLGDYSFGKPARITANTYPGKGGIINIEREIKMSGRIHNKAIMILTSYLGRRYVIDKPISLTAYITFEQLYEMIEGDSATCAELYVLLSSISGIPLKQSIAVTGSMDQNGEVQPVGGINEKIEGFLTVCKSRGLDGSHGVIIPSRNIKHLVLNDEVIEAVSKGLFTIYAIDRVEEGIEILTGIKAGDMKTDGTYEEDTFNHKVMTKLNEYAMKFEKSKEKENNGQDKRTDRETD